MFAFVISRLNALPEYVSPVPAVVVAYDPTSPPYTASCPSDSAGSLKAPLNVDDAVEKRPFRKPMVVEVELYPETEVNGKTDDEPLVDRHIPPIA